MSRGAGLLFPVALGVSAAAHLLALFLWPYSPPAPGQSPPQPIPVRLLETPPRSAPPPAPPARRVARPAPAPEVPEPEPEPATPEAPLELAPPQPAASEESVPQAQQPPGPAAAAVPAGTEGVSALAAEVAAAQAVLLSLRSRIVAKIRYPPLAQANGWKGTVLLEVLLDGEGRLQGLAVRRTSGYTVLDRAASALLRSLTPVDNPLGRPLRIQVPIAYEPRE